MSKPAVDKHVHGLMTSVSEMLGPIAGEEPSDTPAYLLEPLSLFDRCRSTLGAIRLLLAYDFVHEAVALTRPLFADSLALAEMAAADEAERKRLVAGRELAAVNDMEGLAREAESRGDDVSAEMAALHERRAHVEEFARSENIKPRPWRSDQQLKALAHRHGRGDEYMDLRITHLFVHGSPFATRQRYAQTDERIVEVGGHAVDLKAWASPTGLFASHSALHAARAACAIFGWTEPPDLEVLMAEVREELEHMTELSEDQRAGQGPLDPSA